jgi:hypothetical protein
MSWCAHVAAVSQAYMKQQHAGALTLAVRQETRDAAVPQTGAAMGRAATSAMCVRPRSGAGEQAAPFGSSAAAGVHAASNVLQTEEACFLHQEAGRPEKELRFEEGLEALAAAAELVSNGAVHADFVQAAFPADVQMSTEAGAQAQTATSHSRSLVGPTGVTGQLDAAGLK